MEQTVGAAVCSIFHGWRRVRRTCARRATLWLVARRTLAAVGSTAGAALRQNETVHVVTHRRRKRSRTVSRRLTREKRSAGVHVVKVSAVNRLDIAAESGIRTRYPCQDQQEPVSEPRLLREAGITRRCWCDCQEPSRCRMVRSRGRRSLCLYHLRATTGRIVTLSGDAIWRITTVRFHAAMIYDKGNCFPRP